MEDKRDVEIAANKAAQDLSYVHNVSLGKTRRVVSRRYMTDRVAFIVHNGNVNTEL